jgi:hypothetical protein
LRELKCNQFKDALGRKSGLFSNDFPAACGGGVRLIARSMKFMDDLIV